MYLHSLSYPIAQNETFVQLGIGLKYLVLAYTKSRYSFILATFSLLSQQQTICLIFKNGLKSILVLRFFSYFSALLINT